MPAKRDPGVMDDDRDDGIRFEKARGERFKAPWDWHALPIDEPTDATSKAKPGAELTIEQSSGRKIWLVSLHQYFTYGGLLAGLPQARDSYVEDAVRTAIHYCGENEMTLAVLRPRLTRLRMPADEVSWGEWLPSPELPAAQLPWVTCIAKFHSDTVLDKNAFLSSAVAIWYQDGYGLPADEHILSQLRDLDWPAHAWDRDP